MLHRRGTEHLALGKTVQPKPAWKVMFNEADDDKCNATHNTKTISKDV